MYFAAQYNSVTDTFDDIMHNNEALGKEQSGLWLGTAKCITKCYHDQQGAVLKKNILLKPGSLPARQFLLGASLQNAQVFPLF